jgi:two-component system nitrogen regulation response regulator NtrX
MVKSVLIVDDELDIQSSLSMALKDEGYEVFTATLPKEAEELLSRHTIDIGLFDVWFPEGDGLELLKHARAQFHDTPIVMMSGHGNIELALKAIRMGAYDFLEKPLELEKVLVVLRNAAESQGLRLENKRLSLERLGSQKGLVGESQSLRSLRQWVEKAAQAPSHVLISGENGTGKELVAQLLHYQSPRAAEPFVAVNCAAIPEGLFESEVFGHEKGSFTGAQSRQLGRFEQAGAGTIFLDEIGELSLAAQGKLLRVLEERTFERVGGRSKIPLKARVVVATNKNLQAEVKASRFREDLFFRLNVLAVSVAPLRERPDDVGALSEHLLSVCARDNKRRAPRLKKELIDALARHDWPGNVRELKNLLERMLLMGTEKAEWGVEDLPDDFPYPDMSQGAATADMSATSGSLRDLRGRFEKETIEARLKQLQGNVTRTAESLGVERAHLHRKMRQFGIRS